MANEQPVARILDIALLGGVQPVRQYLNGQFLPVYLDRDSSGNVENVAAVVIRNHRGTEAAVAHTGQLLYVGDVLRTGPETLLALEFLIGGRVSVKSSACVEIASERSVTEKISGWANPFKRMLAKPREPLQIQTNGGTIGIKG